MTTQVEDFFAGPVAQLTQTLQRVQQSQVPSAEPSDDSVFETVRAAIEECLVACKTLQSQIEDDVRLLRSTQERFRAAIQPWFDQSWCMRHALAKPRGYAGDYQMLTTVYDRQVKSLGLGGYLDRYFLQTELGTSVPLRLKMARDFLIGESLRCRSLKILNIASGPGREYVGGWGLPDDCRVDVTCADLDDEAIAFVQQNVIPTLPPTMSMKMVRHNALKIGNVKMNHEAFGVPDVIYSVGLFDYIPDRLLVRMLGGLRETVAKSGVIYLAFKDCNFYDATAYQWLVDWYFYQRTEAECRALLAQAGYPVDELEMTRDDTGSIINYICRQPPQDAADWSEESETIDDAAPELVTAE
ncbi:MAG: hypothetical protein SFV23_02055 [Planctomycetaceae bacterium]|nr:hypothetical protein [Planctomycetaceae bacterium]